MALRTDLVSTQEFQEIELTLFPVNQQGVSRREFILADPGGYDSPRRLVELTDLPADDYRLGISLRNGDGESLIEQPMLVTVRKNRTAIVRISRSCLNIECSSDQACFGGECVDLNCTEESLEDCGSIPFCTSDEDCATSAACSEGYCDDSLCWARNVPEEAPEACDPLIAWCNPSEGCLPLTKEEEEENEEEASCSDGSLNGSETGIDCGGICTRCDARLVGDSVLFRYYLDEAALGQGPDFLVDAAEDPLPLALDYEASNNMNFEDRVSGRGLTWSVTESSGKACASAGENKIDKLRGLTSSTIEAVVRLGEDTANGGVVLHLGEGTRQELALDVRRVAGNHSVRFSVLDSLESLEPLSVTWNLSLPHVEKEVWTIVFDSTETLLSDRVRFYRDGELEAPRASVSDGFSQGKQLVLSAFPSLCIGNNLTSGNTPAGGIYFLSIYNRALDGSEILQNAEALLTSDDAI